MSRNYVRSSQEDKGENEDVEEAGKNKRKQNKKNLRREVGVCDSLKVYICRSGRILVSNLMSLTVE